MKSMDWLAALITLVVLPMVFGVAESTLRIAAISLSHALIVVLSALFRL